MTVTGKLQEMEVTWDNLSRHADERQPPPWVRQSAGCLGGGHWTRWGDFDE